MTPPSSDPRAILAREVIAGRPPMRLASLVASMTPRSATSASVGWLAATSLLALVG